MASSEERLIKKLHAGHGEAFREVFKMYYLPVRSYAFHYVKQEDIAEDIVQDVFLVLWERRTTFEALLMIKKFLYTCVRHACLDYLKHARVERVNMPGLLTCMTDELDRDFILEEEVDALIYRAVHDLSEQSRRIVILTMNGATNAEIAGQIGISINTVKTLKMRAYRVLRERLKGLQWFLFLLLS